MIDHIPADSRGLTKTPWLTSYHSFSFGSYFNPEKQEFGQLRVLNDDTVAGGKGFGLHPHDNMEIVTIVLQGALEHKDSSGGSGVLKAGQMQRMTAGSGIHHSEFNASKTEPVHFLQIWIIPENFDLEPQYEQKDFTPLLNANQLALLVAPEKKKESLFIHQNVQFHMAQLEQGKNVNYSLSPGRGVYAFLIDGEVSIGAVRLKARDAAQITGEKTFSITASKPSQILLIETPI